MSYSLPLLLWLRTFEAAARHLSFAKAAEELGLTAAAVGQHIKALETHLGFSLFDRLPRGVRLSTIGRAYVPTVRKALDDLTVATLSLFGSPQRGQVTVRSSVSFAALVLAPLLPQFRAEFPEMPVTLYASIWSDDLAESQIDLDIRYGDGRWDGFDLVEPISEAISVPVCPVGTAFGADPAEAVRRLAMERRIQIVGLGDLWRRLGDQFGWDDGMVREAYAVDTSAIALEMVAAGLGVAMISKDLTRLHAGRGQVVVPPGIELAHEQRHYLLMPRHRTATSPEALLFRDWLLARLG